MCYNHATMLTKEAKQKTIKGVQTHKNDTGSPEVQVSLLSKRIDELADHLKTHQKDNHSRRGLLAMVADRRSILSYLKKTSEERYAKLVKKLGLKQK